MSGVSGSCRAAGWSLTRLNPFPSYPFDRIKRLYDINVHGAFFTAREAARNMIPQGGGSITLVGSMSANVSNYPPDVLGFWSVRC